MPPVLSIRIVNRIERVRARNDLHPVVARLVAVVHFFALVYAQFDRDRCYQMASAMTFTALLAIVPVTAVTFAIFNAFGAFAAIRQTMQQFLLKQLIPSSDLAQKFNEYLTQFTANTYQVTFLSVLSLFVTCVTLFITVEYSLGHIWSETRGRPLLRNLQTFTSILVWGPLLLGLSTYLSLSMGTTAHSYVDPIMGTRFWEYVFPYATSVLMFFLGFTILPAAQVDVRAALLASSFSALLWELAKYGFGVYVTHAVFYANVYGSLSTVPVFLLWLYVSWLIFLFGAEICYCYQYRKWLRMRGTGPRSSYALQLLMALASVAHISRRFREGAAPARVKDIAETLGVPEDVILRALLPLRDTGLLSAVKGKNEVYVLSRSPEKISVLDVFEAVHPADAAGPAADHPAPELASAASVVKRLQQAQQSELGQMSVESLL